MKITGEDLRNDYCKTQNDCKTCDIANNNDSCIKYFEEKSKEYNKIKIIKK